MVVAGRFLRNVGVSPGCLTLAFTIKPHRRKKYLARMICLGPWKSSMRDK